MSAFESSSTGWWSSDLDQFQQSFGAGLSPRTLANRFAI
jgi:hypothetical protein